MRHPKIKQEYYEPMAETRVKEIKTVNGKRFVTVQSLHSEESQTFEVSYCSILIGSRPDLQLLNNIKLASSQKHQNVADHTENIAMRTMKRLKLFCKKCRHMNLCLGFFSKRNLGEETNFGEIKEVKEELLGLCEDTTKPLDVRNNVLAVNKFSNELLNVPRGIFAAGGLVGDNFVRFISGGSLLICSALWQQSTAEEEI